MWWRVLEGLVGGVLFMWMVLLIYGWIALRQMALDEEAEGRRDA